MSSLMREKLGSDSSKCFHIAPLREQTQWPRCLSNQGYPNRNHLGANEVSKRRQVLFAATCLDRFIGHLEARPVKSAETRKRTSPSGRLVLVAGLVCLLFGAKVSLAAQPDGVTLRLALADGRQQYRIGEIIPMRLTFTTVQGSNYSIDLANYDRSGRLDIDTFQVSPAEGWSDPLAYYYDSGLFSFMGGGIRSVPKLGPEAVNVDADLNEWFRFDRPGHFRVIVTSHRIVKDKAARSFGTHIDVTSNEVEFDVIPADEAWARQQLAKALADLKSEDHAISNRGARMLRFLGTDDAVAAMVDQFDDRESGCDGEFEFGLMGSLHRKFVVETMEKELANANHPISPSFLNTLAALSFQVDHPKPIPTSPTLYSPKVDDALLKNLRRDVEKRKEAFNPYVTRYLAQLAASLPRRSGRSYGEALSTILVEGSEAGSLDKPEFAGFYERLRKTIPSVFRQIPSSFQDSLLSFWWGQIGSPAMVPVLREMCDAAPNDFRRGQFISLTNDFDQKMARQMVTKDMKSPDPALLYDSGDVFGNEPLPEIEDVLVRNLRLAAKRESPALRTLSILIARHATAHVLPAVKEVYGQLPWKLDSPVMQYLLAYFFRTDFDFAHQMMESGFKTCSESAKACGTMEPGVFRLVLERSPDARVLELVTDSLASADPHVSGSAAEALKDYGAPESEAALWKRLQIWHEQWKGRADALGQDQNRPEEQLGTKLIEAIAQGAGWLADKDKLARLEPFCILKEQCDEIAGFLDHWKDGPQLEIIVFNYSEVWPHIAQYEYQTLDKIWPKLAQFPAGSALTFTLEFQANEKAKGDALTAEVNQFAKAHKLILTVKSTD